MANFFDQFDAPGASAPQPDYGRAIASVESGGRYDALGPATRTGDRALGKYQVMGANVGPWTQEVLGQPMSPQDFLANPQAQDAVFKAKFGNYVSKYGPEGAARAWFAGEGGMNDPNRRDVLGTSVAQYGQKFTAALSPSDQRAHNLANGFAPDSAPTPNFFDQFDNGPPSSGRVQITVHPQEHQQEQGPPIPPDMNQTPDIGRLGATMAGVRAGVTGNFNDELKGGEAAGAPFYIMGMPVGALAGMASAGIDALRGGGPALDAYQKARDAERATMQTAREQHPGFTLGGEIAGGAMLPIGGAAAAPTIGGRMLAGAGTGAAYGALSGAGAGTDLASRTTQAATGGLIGGAAGGVMAPAVEGLVRGVTAASTLPAIARAARGAINPEAEAARRVAGAIERDTQAGAAGLNPAEFQASQAAGLPVAVADMGGETTRALARSAANTSPEGRSALETLAQDRFAGQSDRAATFIDNLFGRNVPTTEAAKDAIRTSARSTNRVNYGAAEAEGSAGLWSPELERLAGSDAVSTAMQRAAKAAKDEAIVNGGGAFNPRVTFTADGRMQMARGPNGTPTYPDLQYWDLVRREISDAAQRAGYGTSEARRLNNFAGALNTELDRLVPSYQQARQGAAAAFGARDALDAGAAFVRSSMPAQDGARALAKMAPEEQQMFRQGFASQLINDIRNTRDGVNVLNKIGQSPEARNKLQMVLGPNGYRQLDSLLSVEQGMDRLRRAVSGNSSTTRQLVEAGLAGGAGFELNALGGGDHLDATNVLTAALGVALARGKFRIDERVARNVARMLTSSDPNVLAQGVQTVARNQTLLRAFRSLDLRTVRGVAGQAHPSMLQAPATGRADENK